MRQKTERRKVYHDSAVLNREDRVVCQELRLLVQVAAGRAGE